MSSPARTLLALLLLFTTTTAWSRTLHVKVDGPGPDGTSWSTAFDSIGAALVVSSSGDEIWIAKGRYNETIDLVSGVSLYGGFAGTEGPGEFNIRDWEINETVIDATGLGTHVVNAVAVTGVHLEGISITGAERQNNRPDIAGGIEVLDSSVTLEHCSFYLNEAIRSGGCGLVNSSALIKSCRFIDNIRISGVYATNANFEIVDSVFIGNGPGSRGGGANVISSTGVIHNCTFENNVARNGGGLWIASVYPVSVRNCVFRENTAAPIVIGGGGGIYVAGSGEPVIEDCTFENNGAPQDKEGGAIYFYSSSGVIRNCFFRNNWAEGGGGAIGSSQGGGTISDSTFIGNRSNRAGGGALYAGLGGAFYCDRILFASNEALGGGAYAGGTTRSEFRNCLFNYNCAKYGGGAFASSGGAFENCLFANNRSEDDAGAGIISSGGNNRNATFNNCTSVGNTAAYFPGFIVKEAKATFTNCILRDSPTEQLLLIDVVGGLNDVEPELIVNHSNVWGRWKGEGNIDEDPLFIDPDNDNYELQINSPCVDSASTAGPPADLLGRSRPKDVPGVGRDGPNAFDMGCYEFPANLRDSRLDFSGDGFLDSLDLFVFQRDWLKVSQ